jgi:hypothetical protein
MTTINLDALKDLVCCKCHAPSDEVNHAGRSYRPDRRGYFYLPSEAMPALEHVGGFYRATPSKKESLTDIGTAVFHMTPCREKGALVAVLASVFDAPAV